MSQQQSANNVSIDEIPVDIANSRSGDVDPTEVPEGIESITRGLAGEDHPSTVVEPKHRGISLEEIVADHFDYPHHGAFFVVSPTFEVTAYQTLWFGLEYDSETVQQGETVGNDTLTPVRWHDGQTVGASTSRAGFQALKDVDGQAVSEAETRGVDW